MRAGRVAGLLSIMAVVAAAALAGVSFSFFSSSRPNPANRFVASPDFSAIPLQGSEKVWSGLTDFAVGNDSTIPVPTGIGVLELAFVSSDQEATATVGALTNTVPARVAQTFQPSNDQTLGSVSLVLSADGAGPFDDLTVSIVGVTGGVPAGPDLATATVPASSLSATPTAVTVAFGTPPPLAGALPYAIVLEGSGVGWQSAEPYPGGEALAAPDGVTFAPAGGDLAFTTSPATGGLRTLSGTQTSDPFVIGATGPQQFLALTWDADVPAGTSVTFQLAVADEVTDTAASLFLGPDGTTATVYSTPASPLWVSLNGFRVVRYQAVLGTSDPTVSPVVRSVRLSWDYRPLPPNLVAPVGPSSPTPTFTWTAADPDDDVLSFLFQISADPTFVSTRESRVNLQSTTYTPADTLPPGTYHWRVASFDGLIQSAWPAAAQIEVA